MHDCCAKTQVSCIVMTCTNVQDGGWKACTSPKSVLLFLVLTAHS